MNSVTVCITIKDRLAVSLCSRHFLLCTCEGEYVHSYDNKKPLHAGSDVHSEKKGLETRLRLLGCQLPHSEI